MLQSMSVSLLCIFKFLFRKSQGIRVRFEKRIYSVESQKRGSTERALGMFFLQDFHYFWFFRRISLLFRYFEAFYDIAFTVYM